MSFQLDLNLITPHQKHVMTESAFHHFYGIMDGILLTIVILLILFAFRNYIRGQDTRLPQTYILLAMSFMGFEGFNVFLQHAHQAPTVGFYPAWLVKVGSLTVPISLGIMTYFYGHAMGLYSYSASQALQRVKWVTRLIYWSLAAVFFVLLLSGDVEFMVRLLVASFLLPCLSGTYVAWTSMGSHQTSKLIAFIMTLLVVGNLVMLWYSFGGRLLGKELFMLQVHLSYGLMLIVICHILLSMGRDELQDVFKRYSMSTQKIISDMSHGLKKRQFHVHYQPQVDLNTTQVCGIEALIRWDHPEKGNVPPNDFIAIAEETGLIENITMWVIECSIKHARRLENQGYALDLSINFSPKCFKMTVVEHLARQLKRFSVPAERVTIEITENMMIKEEDPEVKAAFASLQKMGVQLSIDDYGTGFSSLSYLKKMSVRELKIDRSFVADITDNKDNFAIVKSTLQMTQSLDIQVVAEGVETDDVMQCLKGIGCNKAQGYGIAKPMPYDELLVYLTSNKA